MAGRWHGRAIAVALASGLAKAGSRLLPSLPPEGEECRRTTPLDGEASALVQRQLSVISRHAEASAEEAALFPRESRVFDDHAKALSRMLYGFFMLASCPQLLTGAQVKGSNCKHCERAGFRYKPGELRIIQLRSRYEPRDNVAVVAKLHPLGAEPGGCTLAIRGTQTMGNFVSNLDFTFVPFPDCLGCLVHEGWMKQWLLLRPHVLQKLGELDCDGDGQALYITGHSSGCALADYAAVQLRKVHGYRVQAAISFNCPKPGNLAFAQAFDSLFPRDVWKVQVEWDPIRHLPPSWTGYVDVGWTVQYLHGGENEGYYVCGKRGTLCTGESPLRFGSSAADMDWWRSLGKEINNYHCAAPHPDTWNNQAYLRCDAECDATLMEPDWGLLDLKEDKTAAQAANVTQLPPIPAIVWDFDWIKAFQDAEDMRRQFARNMNNTFANMKSFFRGPAKSGKAQTAPNSSPSQAPRRAAWQWPAPQPWHWPTFPPPKPRAEDTPKQMSPAPREQPAQHQATTRPPPMRWMWPWPELPHWKSPAKPEPADPTVPKKAKAQPHLGWWPTFWQPQKLPKQPRHPSNGQ